MSAFPLTALVTCSAVLEYVVSKIKHLESATEKKKNQLKKKKIDFCFAFFFFFLKGFQSQRWSCTWKIQCQSSCDFRTYWIRKALPRSDEHFGIFSCNLFFFFYFFPHFSFHSKAKTFTRPLFTIPLLFPFILAILLSIYGFSPSCLLSGSELPITPIKLLLRWVLLLFWAAWYMPSDITRIPARERLDFWLDSWLKLAWSLWLSWESFLPPGKPFTKPNPTKKKLLIIIKRNQISLPWGLRSGFSFSISF